MLTQGRPWTRTCPIFSFSPSLSLLVILSFSFISFLSFLTFNSSHRPQHRIGSSFFPAFPSCRRRPDVERHFLKVSSLSFITIQLGDKDNVHPLVFFFNKQSCCNQILNDLLFSPYLGLPFENSTEMIFIPIFVSFVA